MRCELLWASARSPGGSRGDGSSVEEDGVGVSVGDLRQVFEYVLLSDDSQQPPEDNRGEKTGVRDEKISSGNKHSAEIELLGDPPCLCHFNRVQMSERSANSDVPALTFGVCAVFTL